MPHLVHAAQQARRHRLALWARAMLSAADSRGADRSLPGRRARPRGAWVRISANGSGVVYGPEAGVAGPSLSPTYAFCASFCLLRATLYWWSFSLRRRVERGGTMDHRRGSLVPIHSAQPGNDRNGPFLESGRNGSRRLRCWRRLNGTRRRWHCSRRQCIELPELLSGAPQFFHL